MYVYMLRVLPRNKDRASGCALGGVCDHINHLSYHIKRKACVEGIGVGRYCLILCFLIDYPPPFVSKLCSLIVSGLLSSRAPRIQYRCGAAVCPSAVMCWSRV